MTPVRWSTTTAMSTVAITTTRRSAAGCGAGRARVVLGEWAWLLSGDVAENGGDRSGDARCRGVDDEQQRAERGNDQIGGDLRLNRAGECAGAGARGELAGFAALDLVPTIAGAALLGMLRVTVREG